MREAERDRNAGREGTTLAADPEVQRTAATGAGGAAAPGDEATLPRGDAEAGPETVPRGRQAEGAPRGEAEAGGETEAVGSAEDVRPSASPGGTAGVALRVLLPYAVFVIAWSLVTRGAADAAPLLDPGAWEPWLFLTLSVSLLYVLVRREARAGSGARKTLLATLAAVPDAVAILSGEDGSLVEANEGFARFGYNRRELLGHSLEETGLWREGETERLEAQLRASDGVHDLEAAFRTKDGTPRTVVVSARSVNGGSRTVLVARDVTAEREYRARSEWQLLHDPLTGLPNRDLVLDRLAQGLQRARRRRRRVAVFSLNLDRFRVVNESLGHEVGDALLEAIGERLSSSLRGEDTVSRTTPVGASSSTLGRLGGDEFTVILENIRSVDDARVVLGRLGRAMSEPFSVEGHTLSITACVGVAISQAEGESEPTELLRQAAIALRRAKEKGLGREHVFDATVDSRAVRRLRLEGDLRAALDRGDLELHYQPIVSMESGLVVGVESLMRWKHDELGYISPLEIIPIAEESGLIIELGRWVLGEACRQVTEWDRRLPRLGPLRVAVNVSAREIREAAFGEMVAEVLGESGLPPQRLELEITEGLMMQSLLGLRQLKGLDVRVAIDDFGTGYSSLAYLSRLPVDAIKIDRSFVEELGASDDSTAVGRAMVAMADSLHLDTIAEGIETEEQLAAVRELGCTYGQGYLFSRPLPPDRTEALLADAPRW